MVLYLKSLATLSVAFVGRVTHALPQHNDVKGQDTAEQNNLDEFNKSTAVSLESGAKGKFMDDFPFIAPGPDDLRSPCPFVNSMANHGFINRNGRDVPIFDMAGISREVFDLSFATFSRVIETTIGNGQAHLAEDGETILLNLDNLWGRPGEERDISLVHQDPYLVGEIGRRKVDEGLLNSLLNKNPGSDLLFIEHFAEHGFDRIIDARVNNPNFKLNICDLANGSNQYWFPLVIQGSMDMSGGVPKSYIKDLLLHNKLPEFMTPRFVRDPSHRPFATGDWGVDVGLVFLETILEKWQTALEADLSEFEHRRRTPNNLRDMTHKGRRRTVSAHGDCGYM